MFGLKTLVRRLQGMSLLVLIVGLGAAGYIYRDTPLVRQLLGDAEKKIGLTGLDGKSLKEDAKAVLTKVVGEFEGGNDSGPGRYEVTIAKVSLDDVEFRAGKTVDLQALVIRRDPRGKATTLWESKHAGERLGVAGRGPITADWSDRPFAVDWKPGDEYSLELWDHKGLRPTKRFTLELDDDGDFPLRSKTHKLDTLADGRPVHDAMANTVVIRSRRIGSLASSPEPAVAKGEGRAGRKNARRN
jgi:hypothetical protein